MKQIRIQSPSLGVFEVDVQCLCGCNGLQNMKTFEESFRHRVVVGGEDVYLQCGCGKQYLLRPQTDHVHILDVPTASGDLSAQDWEAIHAACGHSKWYALIRLFGADKNRGLDLKHADNLLAREVRRAKADNSPSYRARTYLNNLLKQAGLPFRIQKIENGKTCYDGVIQICRLKKKSS